MASGVQRLAGTFIATGALQSVLTVQWRPKKVTVYNRTTGITLEWNEAFEDASGKKTLAAGTVSFVTTGGITPVSNGFTLGTDSVNTAAAVCYWEAFQ